MVEYSWLILPIENAKSVNFCTIRFAGTNFKRENSSFIEFGYFTDHWDHFGLKDKTLKQKSKFAQYSIYTTGVFYFLS